MRIAIRAINELKHHARRSSSMRPDEAFVGRALVRFFGGPSRAYVGEGDDPPDLYLTVRGSRAGVEVTRLSQFTFEADGGLGNRATEDSFGIRLLNELDATIGPSVPDDVSLLIGLSVPVTNPHRFKKTLTKWVAEVAPSVGTSFEDEREIEGSRTTISATASRPSGKRIVGFVANTNSSADIGLNARLILENRIRTKSQICARLAKPVWLALLNDYWLADAETYILAGRQLQMRHCFDRLLLVSHAGAVQELPVGV